MNPAPLQISTHSQVEQLINTYPPQAQTRLFALRQLIFETAAEIQDLDHLEETLKWGEPSYLTKKGSTLRMDWKAKTPNQYALYFSCSSKLVPTFRNVFKSQLRYEGNRAVLFNLNDPLPTALVKQCIRAALRYKVVRNMDDLGINY